MTVELVSKEIEVLEGQELKSCLEEAVVNHKAAILSFLTHGRWQILRVGFVAASDHALILDVLSKYRPVHENIQVNQPVGMSFQIEFTKYIFESSVIGVESVVNKGHSGKIILRLPDRIEALHRRGYQRQEVPKNMTVRVLFWHRGYLDQVKPAPVEHYWQGQVQDLSAGGMRLIMNPEFKDCFCVGQLVGLQFTPMSYQKPILLEGHIRHIRENDDENHLQLGIEFLGLEASPEGRMILYRLLDVVAEYQSMNLYEGE